MPILYVKNKEKIFSLLQIKAHKPGAILKTHVWPTKPRSKFENTSIKFILPDSATGLALVFIFQNFFTVLIFKNFDPFSATDILGADINSFLFFSY